MTVPSDLVPVCSTTPGLDRLLGPSAVDLVGAALDATTHISDLTVSQIRLLPGSRAIVQYRATETTDGRKRTATYVAALGASVPDGVAVVEGGGHQYAVWRYPNDPELPGLASISGTANATALTGQLGIAGTPVVRHRSYRPMRRAVVEFTSDRAAVFVKVVAPRRVADLRATHVALHPVIGAPMVRGWHRDLGLLALDAVDGSTLRQALAANEPTPDPSAIVTMTDRLASVDGVGRPAPTPIGRLQEHLAWLAAIAPSLSSLLTEIGERIGPEDSDPGPSRTVHGDLHASQLMVRDGSLVGVLDVDRAGSGDPVTDPANLLAHLAVLDLVAGDGSPFGSYARSLLEAFDEVVTDPGELRRSTAAAIVGFATGPFRVLEDGWLDATEARLERARAWASEV